MRLTGGCLCGTVRYEAEGEPTAAGFCCYRDCRKASGSGFIPFMGFKSSAVKFSGETCHVLSMSARGTDAVRNTCPTCDSLVFGGIVGKDSSHTIYAGSLDDPSHFKPTMVLFNRDRPDWVVLPEGLTVYETMPD